MQARKLPAIAGWRWLQGGLKLWLRSPGVISLATLLTLLLTLLPGVIPLLGPLLASLVTPFLYVVLLHVFRRLAGGGAPQLNRLQGRLMRMQRGLLVLGLVLFLAALAGQGLLVLFQGEALARYFQAVAKGGQGTVTAGLQIGLMLYALGVFALSAVIWVSSALTGFAQLPPMKSLVFAVVACWRNKLAFAVFALALVLLSVPLMLLFALVGMGAMLTLLFGVLTPVSFACMHFCITDIFGPLPEPDDAR
ncbi:MAG: BPSS1780 family membrane protein [Rhodocyclaceae bacterium]